MCSLGNDICNNDLSELFHFGANSFHSALEYMKPNAGPGWLKLVCV